MLAIFCESFFDKRPRSTDCQIRYTAHNGTGMDLPAQKACWPMAIVVGDLVSVACGMRGQTPGQ